MAADSPKPIATNRPKRAALNWTDYLVIAATTLTFLAVVVANNPHAARAQSQLSSPAASVRLDQTPERARPVTPESVETGSRSPLRQFERLSTHTDPIK
ncbi:MAG: hypothetical protein JSR90_07160 [Proteobacteria bacterium]|nr:hypothetical protein [Pseudomonadota bacterium]